MKGAIGLIVWILIGALLLVSAYLIYEQYNASPDLGDASPDLGDASPNPGDVSTLGNEGTRKGNILPNFTLSDLSGKTVQLKNLRGKIVVVNFWATWCGPCIREMPEFNEASREFEKENEVKLLAINITDGISETEEKVKEFVNQNGYTLQVLLDKGGKVADRFKITGIPTTFVLDRQGKIVEVIVGSTTKAKLLSIIERIG